MSSVNVGAGGHNLVLIGVASRIIRDFLLASKTFSLVSNVRSFKFQNLTR
jgi:hypothetical protein